MSKFWNWLDKKKSIFGLIILNIAQAVPEDVMILDIPVVSVLYWLGGILSGTGLGHKGVKAIKKRI